MSVMSSFDICGYESTTNGKPSVKHGKFSAGADFRCGANVVIDVEEEVVVGDRCVLPNNAYLGGRRIVIGDHSEEETMAIGPMVGNIYGCLTVVGFARKDLSNRSYWRCRCACGNDSYEIRSDHLAKNPTYCKSCHPRNRKHGDAGLVQTPEYLAWENMRFRCENPRHRNYAGYGGRGITVDPRWQDYSNFLADMGRRPSAKHQLERIDNDLGYSPSNCIWATSKQQMRNTRRNHLVMFNGQVKCLSAWAEETGIKASVIRRRLELGWSVKQAMTYAVGQQKGRQRA